MIEFISQRIEITSDGYICPEQYTGLTEITQYMTIGQPFNSMLLGYIGFDDSVYDMILAISTEMFTKEEAIKEHLHQYGPSGELLEDLSL